MSKEYDCYGYFCVDYAHNTYPIRNIKSHLESIFSLKSGDILHIKGIGQLQVRKLNVDEYSYRDNGKDGLYQEIAISCITI